MGVGLGEVEEGAGCGLGTGGRAFGCTWDYLFVFVALMGRGGL